MKTILVVDDEPLIRDLVSEILERSGFKTIVCSSGEEAILFINFVDAVVTDFQMSEMDGADLAKIVKRRRPCLPVLIMTGRTKLVPRNHLADKIIEKPFDSINVIPSWLLEVLPEETE